MIVLYAVEQCSTMFNVWIFYKPSAASYTALNVFFSVMLYIFDSLVKMTKAPENDGFPWSLVECSRINQNSLTLLRQGIAIYPWCLDMVQVFYFIFTCCTISLWCLSLSLPLSLSLSLSPSLCLSLSLSPSFFSFQGSVLAGPGPLSLILIPGSDPKKSNREDFAWFHVDVLNCWISLQNL